MTAQQNPTEELRDAARRRDPETLRRLLRQRAGTLKINVGCGAEPREGYLNVDIRDLRCVDLVCDVFDLPRWVPDGAAEEIYSKDCYVVSCQAAPRNRIWR